MHAYDYPAKDVIPTHKDRKFCRGDVAIAAQIRAFGGLKSKVNILDISASGFRMESMTYMSQDQILYLTLPSFHQMEAAIVWQTEWMYGCHFARPLYPAVVDHIIQTFPSIIKSPTTMDGFMYGATASQRWSKSE